MFKHLKLRNREFYMGLLKFSGPIILQNLVTASAGFVDTFMVGTLGQNELSALSVANTPFFIATLFIFGMQSGSSVLISQYWGKGDKGTISRVVGISWMLALAITIVFSLAMFLFPHEIMGLLTNNDRLAAIAARYTRVVAFSQVFSSFVTIYIGARRSCESPRFGTVVVTIGVLSNVFFNYIFIFGKLGSKPMGVEGAALGTVLARGVELVVTILYIFFGDRRKKRMPLFLKKLIMPGKLIARDFVRYSVPVIMNETLWSLGVSLYVVIYGHMEASGDITAAYSLAGNIERIVLLVSMSVAHSAAVYIGKAIGGGGSRADVLALGKTFESLSVLTGIASGVLLLGALYGVVVPVVFPVMNLTASAQQICIYMLILRSIISVFRAYNATLIVGTLRGGGDVKYSLFLDIGGIYLWALPTALLAAFVFKLDIYWVYPFIISEDLIKMFFGCKRFKSGRWISNVTREM